MIVIFQVEKQKRLKNQPFLFQKFFLKTYKGIVS